MSVITSWPMMVQCVVPGQHDTSFKKSRRFQKRRSATKKIVAKPVKSTKQCMSVLNRLSFWYMFWADYDVSNCFSHCLLVRTSESERQGLFENCIKFSFFPKIEDYLSNKYLFSVCIQYHIHLSPRTTLFLLFVLLFVSGSQHPRYAWVRQLDRVE